VEVRTVTKWDKIREFVNLWLRDPQMYCGSCNMNYSTGVRCCDNPQLGTNISFAKDIIDAVKDLRKQQKNVFGSNSKKTFRTVLKLPNRLFMDLDKFCKIQFGQKLFGSKIDHIQFAKKFPQFAVPERI
jgi:hypothetical protein